jgi:transcriptional regulator with XRE-family HTH domain
MGTKAGRRQRAHLPKFGDYVAMLRKDKPALASQNDAAKALGLSQSVLAKYERGTITDPHPGLLKNLAHEWGKPYLEIIATLVREKYDLNPPDGWSTEEKLMWDLIKRIIAESDHKSRNVPLDVPLEDALRSRKVEFELGDVLDVPALARWQTKSNLPSLGAFWVIAPVWLADKNDQIFNAVVENLKARNPVVYTYFIYPDMLSDYRRLKAKLGSVVGANVDALVNACRLPDVRGASLEFSSRFFGTPYVVANPDRMQQAVAYQGIRKHGTSVLFLKLDEEDTGKLVASVDPLDKLDQSENPTRAIPAAVQGSLTRSAKPAGKEKRPLPHGAGRKR